MMPSPSKSRQGQRSSKKRLSGFRLTDSWARFGSLAASQEFSRMSTLVVKEAVGGRLAMTASYVSAIVQEATATSPSNGVNKDFA
jgi:hypothetical protein